MKSGKQEAANEHEMKSGEKREKEVHVKLASNDYFLESERRKEKKSNQKNIKRRPNVYARRKLIEEHEFLFERSFAGKTFFFFSFELHLITCQLLCHNLRLEEEEKHKYLVNKLLPPSQPQAY